MRRAYKHSIVDEIHQRRRYCSVIFVPHQEEYTSTCPTVAHSNGHHRDQMQNTRCLNMDCGRRHEYGLERLKSIQLARPNPCLLRTIRLRRRSGLREAAHATDLRTSVISHLTCSRCTESSGVNLHFSGSQNTRSHTINMLVCTIPLFIASELFSFDLRKRYGAS